MTRLAASFITLLVAGSLVSGMTSDGNSAAQVRDDVYLGNLASAVERVDASLQTDITADVEMAWKDLREDLMTVARDVTRDRSSADAEAMVRRIERFWTVHGGSSVAPDQDAWSGLTVSFRALTEIQADSGSAGTS